METSLAGRVAWRPIGVRAGLGACCMEAQADGVPCLTLGVDCLECERGAPASRTMLREAPARRWPETGSRAP